MMPETTTMVILIVREIAVCASTADSDSEVESAKIVGYRTHLSCSMYAKEMPHATEYTFNGGKLYIFL